MGYKILYPGVKKRQYQNSRRLSSKSRLIIIASLCSALVLAAVLWYTGLGWILPGDSEVTQYALQTMIDRLQDGEALGDAVAAFCREVVASAR